MRGMRGATFVRKNGKGLCGKARQPFTCRGVALRALARNARLTLGKKGPGSLKILAQPAASQAVKMAGKKYVSGLKREAGYP